VVGRFVEQQQVRLGHQGLGQQDAATPAAGQFGEGLVGRQLQAAQGAVHQLLQAPAVTGFEVLLDVHQLVQVFFGNAVLRQVMVLRKQLTDAVQAFGDHVEHCPSVGHRQFLRQFANLEARGAPYRAVIGLLVAFYQLHHAGLAGAVAADDAHPLTTAICQDTLSNNGIAPKARDTSLNLSRVIRFSKNWARILPELRVGCGRHFRYGWVL